jgi:hypothetical protein
MKYSRRLNSRDAMRRGDTTACGVLAGTIIFVTFILCHDLEAAGTPSPARPNIIFILTDDQGYDDRMLFHHVARWPSGLAASHKYAMCGVRQGHYLLLRSTPSDEAEKVLRASIEAANDSKE